MRYSNLIYYYLRQMRKKKVFWSFFISCIIIFINSQGIAGIPLEKEITPEEAKARYEEMKAKKQQIAREIWEGKQKKKEELEKEKQLIKDIEAPEPTPKKEEKPLAKKEEVKEEVKTITTPPEEKAKGIIPGDVPLKEEIEEVKKIQKREKAAQELKYKRNLSFILVIVVIVVTIVFLIRSMYKGRPKDEEKKK